MRKTAKKTKDSDNAERQSSRWSEMGLAFFFFASEILNILSRSTCSGTPVGRRLQRQGACLPVFRVAATGRGDGGMSWRRRVGFGIPGILAEEHTCPEPDINQLFQE